MSELNHVELWNRCLDIIRDNVSEQAYKTWFLPIEPLEFKEKTLLVRVPTQFFYEFLEDKYIDLLRKALYKVFGEGTQLMYDVVVNKSSRPEQTVQMESSKRSILPTKKVETAKIAVAPLPDLDPHLNPNYNFETFIEGVSNKLSRSVAEAVAENPAKTIFNPLFLYGTSGVGKTHLANAIGTRIKELYPEKRVLYVSAHLFQVQYTDSVRNNTTNDFINFYQHIDVLIMDDIQEFAGLTKTQNTFFHIFNQLHQNGKQLILTSDRPPVVLQGMEERLITRFKWGMVAELEKPTVELRRNILMNKIHRDGLVIPMEVVDYIAENVNESVRDLEGIVVSLLAHASVYNRDVDLDLAKRIISKVVHCENKPVGIDQIISVVCNHFGVSTQDLYSKTRKSDVVQARQVAMYLAKQMTELSAAKIGTLIGNKDHATVLHACKTVKAQLEVNKAFQQEMREIKQGFRNPAAS